MKWIFFISVLLLLTFGCRKKQPDLNPAQNACDCLIRQRSTFEMGEIAQNLFIDLDTIVVPIDYMDGNPANFDYNNPVNVEFSSNNPNAISYEWIVGNNQPVIKNNRNFSLSFGGALGTIPVKLITKSKLNTMCIPDDDGYDTIVRLLTLINIDPHPLTGLYYGINNNFPGNIFSVEIDTFRSENNPNQVYFGIKNLPQGNTFDRFNIFGTSFFQGISESGGSNNYVQFASNGINSGLFDYKSRKIEINYSAYYLDLNYNIIDYFNNTVFSGTKN